VSLPAWALKTAVACVSAAAVCSPAGARAQTQPPRFACSAGGGRTLARSARARVFARKGRFYGCWLPTRRRTALGRLGEMEIDGPPVLATHVRIDGEFVAFSLQQYGDPDFDVSSIVSVNVRTGRVVREVEPRETETFDSFVEDVGVARDGALVYLQREGTPCPGTHTTGELSEDAALIAVEPGAKRHTLDCEAPGEPEGSISGLLVADQTVTWMHSGTLHTAHLR
jgi:hypothetical protein